MTTLKEIGDLYALFPERLQSSIAEKRIETFQQLWRQLTPAEKIGINETRTRRLITELESETQTPFIGPRRLGAEAVTDTPFAVPRRLPTDALADTYAGSPTILQRALGSLSDIPRTIQIIVNPESGMSGAVVIPTEVQRYEKKLADLTSNYDSRRLARLKEAESLPPVEAEASLETFDNAYKSLLKITQSQLSHARNRSNFNSNQP
jgi:hypothetical protein